jgi:fructose-1,6-bisphosphatase
VLKSKLTVAGNYTYWVCIYPTDGSQNIDSVSVVVTP